MAAIQTGSGNNRCRATLVHVVSGIPESSIVENVGVAAEIALPSFSVQKLFLLPVCIIAILRFPCRPTSGHVDRGICTSGIAENVGIAIDISLLSHTSPEIQCTSGLNAAILFSGCRRMKMELQSNWAWSKIWG